MSNLTPAGSYGGCRLTSPPVMRASLSARAHALGLETAGDVEEEFHAQRQGWSQGTDYHCPFCDRDLWSPSGARRHMHTQGHKVLRWDWY